MTTHKVLHQIGLTSNYIGYWQLYIAVQLVCENPFRLRHITNNVYNVVARECNCSICCVERNIRTLILKAWRTNKDQLSKIAGYDLSSPPTVTAFIDMLAAHIWQEKMQ